MAGLIMSEYARRHNFYTDFNSFLVRNEVITIATGVIIGIATAHFIRQATNDVVMPTLNVLFFGLIRIIHKPTGTWLGRLLTNTKFLWFNFAQELFMWIAVLLVAFLVIHYGILRVAQRVLMQEEDMV